MGLVHLFALAVELLSQVLLLLGRHAYCVDIAHQRCVRGRAHRLLLQGEVLWCLQGASNLHVQLLYRIALLEHLGCGKLASLSDLRDFRVLQADYHVLGLEVRVDDLAHPVHVVETDQALSR